MAKTLEHISIGLGADAVSAIVEILKKHLADQHVLYVKTRNFHWNVTGMHFAQLHKLFEDQYGQLAEAIDSTAERIRMLGSEAPGSMSAFLGLARLREHEGHAPKAKEMTALLLAQALQRARAFLTENAPQAQLRDGATRCLFGDARVRVEREVRPVRLAAPRRDERRDRSGAEHSRELLRGERREPHDGDLSVSGSGGRLWRSRRAFLSTLPRSFLGKSSTNSMTLGYLCFDRIARTWS
mgnify:CR=1 FL=1